MREFLRQKMIDGLNTPPQQLTRRSAQLPHVPRKAIAVIGMRRSGNTSAFTLTFATNVSSHSF